MAKPNAGAKVGIKRKSPLTRCNRRLPLQRYGKVQLIANKGRSTLKSFKPTVKATRILPLARNRDAAHKIADKDGSIDKQNP
jgi:hypothetical protein